MSSTEGIWEELGAAKTKDRSETGGAHDRNYNEPVLNEVEYNTLLPVSVVLLICNCLTKEGTPTRLIEVEKRSRTGQEKALKRRRDDIWRKPDPITCSQAQAQVAGVRFIRLECG
jgi:hypothetical protein